VSTLSRLARVVAIPGATLRHATASVVGGRGALWARSGAPGHRGASARLLGSGLVCAVAATLTFGAAPAAAADVVPTVTTGSASVFNNTTATPTGNVNPAGGGKVTSCEFDYGIDTTYGTSVACSPATPYTSSTNVTADVTGLSPDTTYHFTVTAANAHGTGTGADQTFTTPGPPTVDSESVQSVTAKTATVDAEIDPFGFNTTYQFQYGTTTAYGKRIPVPAGDLGNAIGDQDANQTITGLDPNTTYHFRVVAHSSQGSVEGPDQTFTTGPPVTVDSESAANITDTTATLKAQINTGDSDTTYQFQYGIDKSYSSGTVPAKPVDIGAATTDVAASVDITGLAPDARYHFRVIASNAFGTVQGADETFKTYASGLPSGLPDGRGYEMVTPPDKDSGEPYFRFDTIEFHAAAVDGSRMAYLSFNAFLGSVFDGSFYESTRGSSDWTTQNLIPPQSTEAGLLCATAGPEMVGYSTDLSKGILEDGGSLIGTCGTDDPPLVPGEPKGVQNLFVRDNDTNTYQLVDVTPGGVTPATAHFNAASADLSHVVFDESAQLTANAPASSDDLYEWTGGAVRLVTILPNGKPVVGTLADGSAGSAFNAVSADASKIFFTAAPAATATTNLYVRENGSTTVQVDRPQGGSGPGGGGQFEAASTDGSVVYFTDDSSAGLTGDTVTNSGPNLYAYSLSTGKLTDLTPEAGAEVAGLSGISADGSYVYFVSDGRLASGATADQNNLYLLHGGTTTFIATLNGSDGTDWSPTSLSARVSDNGQFIAFDSINPLTKYNNTDVNTGNPDDEIFVYQAGSSKTACVSCIPSGVQPSAGASIYPPTTPVFGGNSEVLQRFVSNTGQVFFDTADKLLPSVNGGTRNVYEYEGGQVRLLSSGHSSDDSLFLDSTPDGSDVFFATTDQLVPQDTDDGYDIYDARVGGGFPFSAPPPACVGDGCKPTETAAPPAPVVATVVFFGPGNATPSTSPAAPKPLAKVKANAKPLKSFRFAIDVTIPAKGKLTISGTGLKTLHKSVGARTYKLTIRLSDTKREALKRQHKSKLRIKVHLLYKPASGKSSTATVSVTVKA
jgi:hypothetical protein